jgi:addiction module HigA family antidote
VTILWRVHPGVTLREILESSGITQRTVALEMGVTQKHLNFVVQGKAAITAQFAVRLERALGVPTAEFWMSLQTNYDLRKARNPE